MDIVTLAVFLLLMHAGAAVFISNVLYKQAKLLKTPIEAEIRLFRIVLFFLSIIILIGNIVPIGIDALTIATDNSLGRNNSVGIVGLVYSISNAITALISTYLIWSMYRIAEQPSVTEATEEELRKRIK